MFQGCDVLLDFQALGSLGHASEEAAIGCQCALCVACHAVRLANVEEKLGTVYELESELVLLGCFRKSRSVVKNAAAPEMVLRFFELLIEFGCSPRDTTHEKAAGEHKRRTH